jgi:hypothetical protein
MKKNVPSSLLCYLVIFNNLTMVVTTHVVRYLRSLSLTEVTLYTCCDVPQLMYLFSSAQLGR